jgi:hypothetical protein
MSALLLITAADEPSKAPFLIIGGALAVYAVIVAALGIQRPAFAASAQAQRGVIALTTLVVVLAIAAAVVTS